MELCEWINSFAGVRLGLDHNRTKKRPVAIVASSSLHTFQMARYVDGRRRNMIFCLSRLSTLNYLNSRKWNAVKWFLRFTMPGDFRFVEDIYFAFFAVRAIMWAKEILFNAWYFFLTIPRLLSFRQRARLADYSMELFLDVAWRAMGLLTFGSNFTSS